MFRVQVCRRSAAVVPAAVLCAVLFAGVSGARGAISFSFRGLADIGAANVEAVSDDGKVLVGRYGSTKGYRWSAADGFRDLGSLRQDFYENYPKAVSADGGVVVGRSPTTPYRWTGGVISSLGMIDPYPFGEATAVSADGAVIAGWDSPTSTTMQALRWTVATGWQGLGTLAGGKLNSAAYAISNDGNVLAGFASNSVSVKFATRWTAATGWVSLGKIPNGGTGGEAHAMSADGSVIVGYSSPPGDSGALYHAFRWTAQSGMIDLHGFDPVYNSRALACSDDGRIAGGFSSLGAWVWDAPGGMRLLTDVLRENGVDMTGWHLLEVNGISADGTVVVGEGSSPGGVSQGFIAVIPEPAGCTMLGVAALLRAAAARRGRRGAPGFRPPRGSL